jgi:hypothetical protein
MRGPRYDIRLYMYARVKVYTYMYAGMCARARTYMRACAYIFMQGGAGWLTFLLGRGVCIGLVPWRVRKAKLIISSSDVTGL